MKPVHSFQGSELGLPKAEISWHQRPFEEVGRLTQEGWVRKGAVAQALGGLAVTVIRQCKT